MQNPTYANVLHSEVLHTKTFFTFRLWYVTCQAVTARSRWKNQDFIPFVGWDVIFQVSGFLRYFSSRSTGQDFVIAISVLNGCKLFQGNFFGACTQILLLTPQNVIISVKKSREINFWSGCLNVDSSCDLVFDSPWTYEFGRQQFSLKIV